MDKSLGRVNSTLNTGSSAPAAPATQGVNAGPASQLAPFLSAFGRTFAWAADSSPVPVFGPAGILGALLAGGLEGAIYAGLHLWFAHRDIYPAIGAVVAVIIVAVVTGFSKEAGLGRLVDRITGDEPGAAGAGERGAMGAGAVLISWIVKCVGLYQLFAVGEDISHPTATLLVLLPVTGRFAEVMFLQVRMRPGSAAARTLMLALVWLAVAFLLVQPAFVAALVLAAVPVLVLGGALKGDISSRDLTGLGEIGYLIAVSACAVLTAMY